MSMPYMSTKISKYLRIKNLSDKYQILNQEQVSNIK